MTETTDNTTTPPTEPDNPLTRRLEEIRREKEGLDAEQREIYRQSVQETDPELKVCEDDVAEFLAEEQPTNRIEFPIQVTGIAWAEDSRTILPWKPTERMPTPWVAIRLVHDEYAGKTYLGVHLGDIALSIGIRWSPDTGVLQAGPRMGNPAIYVPELQRVIFGMESWWGPIEGPDDLREITDSDIDDTWYVRALRDLGGEETGGG